MESLATEVTVLAIVQLVSVVLLIVACDPRAQRADPARPGCSRPAAHAVQIVLAVYWAVRLVTLMNEAPGARRASGTLAAVTIVFAAAPVVGLGMVVAGSGRRWFESPHLP